MSDSINKAAETDLVELASNITKYDISTFKAKMRDILDLADDREIEDRTDFSFENRRESDG